MPFLKALDEGHEHELLVNYDAFWEIVISIYSDLDNRGNAKDHLGRF